MFLLASTLAAAAPPCRCVPPDPCWDRVPWSELNASVVGRLHRSRDELATCLTREGGSLSSSACAADLNSTDDEFWLTARPNGYLHTGLFNVWNISTDRSEYSVLARTEADFRATVAFASKHNLRLVVKGTGHDWYGRSTAAGSLLLWTHLRKEKTWHDSFVAEGCDPSTAHAAVTVESGVQFLDLYPDAHKQGKLVMGGGCDSVGVGGCWLAGCFGSFTKRFGSGAINILQANVVLADGTQVTASKCAHPGLFWSLRGGGGGVAGVVTEFVAKSHRYPGWTGAAHATVSAGTRAECTRALAAVLRASAHTASNGTAGEVCDNGGLKWACGESGGTAQIWCSAYEAEPEAMLSMLQPLADWAKAQGGTINATVNARVDWNATAYDPAAPAANLPPGLLERHPDREISTALLASMSKYFPVRLMEQPAGSAALAEALVAIQALLPSGPKGTLPWMGAKGQAGMSAELAAEFSRTSQNPVLADSTGLWLIMYNIPSLPQIPPSSALLKALWPRLQVYAITDPADPLWSTCERGAGGDEAQAAACNAQWNGRIPALQAQLAKVREALWAALPNFDAGGKPLSGSYWCETDYADPEWQSSHWGEAYPQLLRVKDKYDPAGLFVCHHCVGSERWTKESSLNCRVKA